MSGLARGGRLFARACARNLEVLESQERRLMRQTDAQRLASRRMSNKAAEKSPETLVEQTARTPEEAAKLLQEQERAKAELARMMDRRALGLFPWENFGGGDDKTPLTWWQKLYWVVFSGAVVWVAADKAHNYYTTGHWNKTPERKPPRVLIKPTRMKTRVHAALNDLPVDEDNDPFDGLTPEEIEEIIQREAPNGDPFEGMSPEEIEEYIKAEREELKYVAMHNSGELAELQAKGLA